MAALIFIAIPAIIWGLYRVSLPNLPIEFDFDANHGTFFLLLDRYVGLARTMLAVDLLGAAAGKHMNMPLGVIVTLLAGGFYAFAFNVYIVSRYEVYLHHRYLRNGQPGVSVYSLSQYAMTRALGFSAAIFTVCGIAMAVLS